MLSNKLLDMQQLMQVNTEKVKRKEALFEDILGKCHGQIMRYNKEHNCTCCYFSIPIFVNGMPLNMEEITEYLLVNLRDNGLYAIPAANNKIYISWDTKDIDYAKYKQRRERSSLPSTFSDRIDNLPLPIMPKRADIGANIDGTGIHIPGTDGVKGVFTPAATPPASIPPDAYKGIPMNRERTRNARKIQQLRDRDHDQNSNPNPK